MSERLKFIGVPAGMGSILIQISFLLATKKPLEIFVSDQKNLIFDIKRIWQIPDERLIVSLGEDPDAIHWIPSDELCAYVSYLHNDSLFLFGNSQPLKRSRKNCVALCMHHGGGLREDITVRSMPYNKYGTAEEYETLFTMIDRAGYDVITMNRYTMDIEHKAYILNEFCDCVIGYEGGLHHLAHTLKIPSIILPWRYCDNGDPPIPPGIYYEPHRFHADRKTWFVMTDPKQDILTWTPRQLRDKIDDLHINRGNNVLFDPETRFDPATLKITHPYRDLTPRLHEPEFAFIRELSPELDVFKTG